jgi:hypothetical protein
LVRKEFDAAPLESDYARMMVRDLVELDRDNDTFLGTSDDRLWAYLAARPKWDALGYQEWLLIRMIRHSPPADRERHWLRAERLAANQDPTRARVLAAVMKNHDAWARSIPWLKDAADRLPDGDAKLSATHDLFDAYLHVADWKSAEALWPIARRPLSPDETASRLGEIALSAAKAGALDDALRLWRAAANVDRGQFLHLTDLAQLGLKARLQGFYEQLHRDDPASWMPGAALLLLGSSLPAR